jgi:hypothetical protein
VEDAYEQGKNGCFLCGQRRDRCYITAGKTRLYNKKGVVFSVCSVPRSNLEENERNSSVENSVVQC